MRWITLALAALLVLVQAELWFGRGGVPRMVELSAKLEAQKLRNEAAKRRNEQLSPR
jgi:cell division protein FtsB